MKIPPTNVWRLSRPQIVTIESVAHPGFFVSLDSSVAQYLMAFVNCQKGAGPWERFLLESYPDGTFSLQSLQVPRAYLTTSLVSGEVLVRPPSWISGTLWPQTGISPISVMKLRLVPQGDACYLEEAAFGAGKLNMFVGPDGGGVGIGGNFGDDYSLLKLNRITLPDAERIPLALNTDELAMMIKRWGPQIFLHPQEPYMPCSVPWFLDHCTLIHTNAGTTTTVPVSQMPTQGPDDGTWDLRLSDSAKGGELDTAKVSVRAVRRQGGQTELQFYVCYAYNGPGFGGSRQKGPGGINVNFWNYSHGDPGISTAPMGEHYGDWEVCILRVENATNTLKSVILSQHGDLYAFEGDRLKDITLRDFGDGSARPVIYASLNGHAHFPQPGNWATVVQSKDWGLGAGYDALSINQVASGGKRFDCANYFEMISTSWLGNEYPEPSWVDYPGRWGLQHGVDLAMTEDAAKAILRQGPGFFASWSSTVDDIRKNTENNSGPHGPKQQDDAVWLGIKVTAPWEGQQL